MSYKIYYNLSQLCENKNHWVQKNMDVYTKKNLGTQQNNSFESLGLKLYFVWNDGILIIFREKGKKLLF